MISCLIAIKVLAVTAIQVVDVPVAGVAEARAMAAIEAGRMMARRPPTRRTSFGFDCGREGWVAMDLERADVFARPRQAAKPVVPEQAAAEPEVKPVLE